MIYHIVIFAAFIAASYYRKSFVKDDKKRIAMAGGASLGFIFVIDLVLPALLNVLVSFAPAGIDDYIVYPLGDIFIFICLLASMVLMLRILKIKGDLPKWFICLAVLSVIIIAFLDIQGVMRINRAISALRDGSFFDMFSRIGGLYMCTALKNVMLIACGGCILESKGNDA